MNSISELNILDYSEIDHYRLASFLNNRVPWKVTVNSLFNEFNYLNPKVVFKIGLIRGNIICTLAIKPFYMNLSGLKLLAGKIEYSLTSTYAGKKYYKILVEKLLIEARNKKIKILFGLTNNTLVSIYIKHFGFINQQNDLYLFVLKFRISNESNKNSLIRIISEFIQINYTKALFISNRVLINYDNRIESYTIENKLKRPLDIVNFYNKLNNKNLYNFHVNISNEYLNHLNILYNSNFYQHFFYKKNDLNGYIIYSSQNGKVILYDLLALEKPIQKLIFIYLFKKISKSLNNTLLYYTNNKSDLNLRFLKISKITSCFFYSKKIIEGYKLVYYFNYPLNKLLKNRKKIKWNLNAFWFRSIDS